MNGSGKEKGREYADGRVGYCIVRGRWKTMGGRCFNLFILFYLPRTRYVGVRYGM